MRSVAISDVRIADLHDRDLVAIFVVPVLVIDLEASIRRCGLRSCKRSERNAERYREREPYLHTPCRGRPDILGCVVGFDLVLFLPLLYLLASLFALLIQLTQAATFLNLNTHNAIVNS